MNTTQINEAILSTAPIGIRIAITLLPYTIICICVCLPLLTLKAYWTEIYKLMKFLFHHAPLSNDHPRPMQANEREKDLSIQQPSTQAKQDHATTNPRAAKPNENDLKYQPKS